jgi:hypothetical protein
VNLFDGLVVVLFVAGAVGGFRLGFVARASSWLGMAVGLLVGARLARWTIGDGGGTGDHSAGHGLVVAVAMLAAGALAGQLLGLLAGSRLRLVVPSGAPRRVDRALGAGAGIGGVVLAVWLLLPVVTALRDWPARQAESSAVAGLVADRLPAPPDTLRRLAALIGPSRWQDMLTGGVADLDLPAVPHDTGIADAIDADVRSSMVAIIGTACGNTLRGSGFVVDDELVVTNAHVVAGVESPKVVDEAGESHPARVVAFDSGRDLAVLRADTLDARPLPRGSARRGDTGGVYGHPEGGELAVMPYRVAGRETVSVPDLYGTRDTARQIYFLAASLEEGDSGSPLVDPSGEVVGVAFAISSNTAGLAFAATADELDDVLAAARRQLRDDPTRHRDSECLPGPGARTAPESPSLSGSGTSVRAVPR